jgi:AcrR family transcriptional regulator
MNLCDAMCQGAQVSDARRDRWREHRQERREQFVDAAVRAVVALGPDVGMAEIAAEAGVTKPVLYRHFRDKEDVYLAVGLYATDRLMSELMPMLADDGTILERIRRAVGSYVAFVDRYRALYRFVAQRPINAKRDIVAEDKTRIADELTKILGMYLRLFGADAGVAGPSAHGIVGLVQGATDWWLDHPKEMDREALTEHLSMLIWYGIDGLLRSRDIVLDPNQPLALGAQLRLAVNGDH